MSNCWGKERASEPLRQPADLVVKVVYRLTWNIRTELRSHRED